MPSVSPGPLPQTMIDFWRLVWQENVHCIVMMLSQLAEGGMVRCQQYWPDSGSAYYGPYRVTLSNLEKRDGFKLRKFTVGVRDDEMKLMYFSFFFLRAAERLVQFITINSWDGLIMETCQTL